LTYIIVIYFPTRCTSACF